MVGGAAIRVGGRGATGHVLCQISPLTISSRGLGLAGLVMEPGASADQGAAEDGSGPEDACGPPVADPCTVAPTAAVLPWRVR